MSAFDISEAKSDKPGKVSFGNFPGANEISHIGEVKSGVNLLRPTAEDTYKKVGTVPVRRGGLFRHPPTWTEEEDSIIIELLRGKVPLYLIAYKLHCERNALSRHIENTPELRQLKLDMEEAKLDAVEWQLDKLVTQGNPSAIMFYLDRKGQDRGWASAEVKRANSDEESKIVIGAIPTEDVEEAERAQNELKAKDGKVVMESKVFESDPVQAMKDYHAMQSSVMADTVDAEKDAETIFAASKSMEEESEEAEQIGQQESAGDDHIGGGSRFVGNFDDIDGQSFGGMIDGGDFDPFGY